MKRDIDLIRSILLQIEADDQVHTIENYNKDAIFKHVELLVEAGLIEASILRAVESGIIDVFGERLTWSGYEFLDIARNDKLWLKAKRIIGAKSETASFEILQSLLSHLIKSAIGIA